MNNLRKNDMVQHPNHYTAYDMETIEAIKGQSTPEQFRGYLKGNIMKYLSRYQFKNGIEDLRKAQWYLKALREYEERQEDHNNVEA